MNNVVIYQKPRKRWKNGEIPITSETLEALVEKIPKGKRFFYLPPLDATVRMMDGKIEGLCATITSEIGSDCKKPGVMYKKREDGTYLKIETVFISKETYRDLLAQGRAYRLLR